MKALVYRGPGLKAIEDRPKPAIQAPGDAIVKIVKTTICGTDLVRATSSISLPSFRTSRRSRSGYSARQRNARVRWLPRLRRRHGSLRVKVVATI